MNDSEYAAAIKVAEKNNERLNKEVPESIRNRENLLLQKIMSSRCSPVKNIQILFSEMDVIYNYINKYTICKKGCNHCCHYEIMVSDLEVDYINNKVNTRKINIATESNACPFLKRGICSIYEYRPFMCRRHVSINDSHKWCKFDICNIYNFPHVALSEVDKCYAFLLGTDGLNNMKDIRQAFKKV